MIITTCSQDTVETIFHPVLVSSTPYIHTELQNWCINCTYLLYNSSTPDSGVLTSCLHVHYVGIFKLQSFLLCLLRLLLCLLLQRLALLLLNLCLILKIIHLLLNASDQRIASPLQLQSCSTLDEPVKSAKERSIIS